MASRILMIRWRFVLAGIVAGARVGYCLTTLSGGAQSDTSFVTTATADGHLRATWHASSDAFSGMWALTARAFRGQSDQAIHPSVVASGRCTGAASMRISPHTVP